MGQPQKAEAPDANNSNQELHQTPRQKAVKYSSLRQRALRQWLAILDSRDAMWDVIAKLERDCKEWKELWTAKPREYCLIKRLQVAEDTLYEVRKQMIQLGNDLEAAQNRYCVYDELSKYWSQIDKI